MPLSPDEIKELAEALAPQLVADVRKSHHDFWIDPEKHYNDHRVWGAMHPDDIHELREIVMLFKTTKSLWLKAFLGAAMIGAAVVSVLMYFKPH